ncbi:hypothetical protein LAZ67_21001886, partial [Cordylochernes scorpioides]
MDTFINLQSHSCHLSFLIVFKFIPSYALFLLSYLHIILGVSGVVGTFKEVNRFQFGWRPEEVWQEDTVKLCHNYLDKARHIQEAASFLSL